MRVSSMAVAVMEYLLGFMALAVFAAYALGAGPPSDARWVSAFKLGALLASLELVALWRFKPPPNRLIVGGNVWLIVGGVAAFTEQWWLLRLYQQAGEPSLMACMALTGALTLATPAGFVGKPGSPMSVRRASWWMLAATLLALAFSWRFRGDPKVAAVLPVVALSWLNRGLRRTVQPLP